MTQEDKELLLKDLCARLPYGVKVRINHHHTEVVYNFSSSYINDCPVHLIEPYLRPLSSMTEEEEDEFKQVLELELKHLESEESGHTIIGAAASAFEIDFYNKHHLDYRGLIPMGLALEAKEGMYKTE